MGIEKDQLAAVEAFYRGGKPAVTPGMLSDPHFSPNQFWLSLAVSLAAGHADAPTRILTAYSVMAKVGHQAVGTGYGNEQGAPDPHSGLWAAAHGYILWWAMTHWHSALLLAAIAYWADHVAMCREFWTPAGVRMPCARAIFTLAKGEQTTSPRPVWTIDSRLYAWIALPAQTTASAKAAYGNISPPDQICWDLMLACGTLRQAILSQSLTTKLKLAVPIRRWTHGRGAGGGGFDAAMVEDTPMNDRMSWLIVDGRGVILGSGNALATLTAPVGAPDLIGGPGGTVVKGAPAAFAAGASAGATAAAAMSAPKPPPAAAKHAGCLPGLLAVVAGVVGMAWVLCG